MPPMQSGNTEDRSITEILGWANQPAGPEIDELEKALIEHSTYSMGTRLECERELAEAKRNGYVIPR